MSRRLPPHQLHGMLSIFTSPACARHRLNFSGEFFYDQDARLSLGRGARNVDYRRCPSTHDISRQCCGCRLASVRQFPRFHVLLSRRVFLPLRRLVFPVRKEEMQTGSCAVRSVFRSVCAARTYALHQEWSFGCCRGRFSHAIVSWRLGVFPDIPVPMFSSVSTVEEK